jgi:3-hydroxybutyryl-CoA dehydrogenase
MQIVVKASAQQEAEWKEKGFATTVGVHFMRDNEAVPAADAYFDLLYDEEGNAFASIGNRPVFVNDVTGSAAGLPGNFIRVNAWNGFLKRPVMEIATGSDNLFIHAAEKTLDALGWKYQWVPDIPGMIAARVIAMIVNEAYFGLGDGISSKADIDTAMKLGTNYLYGPFEWSEKIGLRNIYQLLKTLSEKENRYAIAPALEKEITDQLS